MNVFSESLTSDFTMPRDYGYALAERRRAQLPRGIYRALARAAQQFVANEVVDVIRAPPRFLPTALAVPERAPKRPRALPQWLKEEQEMSPSPFQVTGGGSFGSVSYYTDKAPSNARQLAKLELDTGRFFNLDNGQVIKTSDYGDQTFSTVTGALLLDELKQYFQQASDHTGLDTGLLEPAAESIYVRDLWMHIDISNASNVPVFLEIYDVRPRDDIPGNAWPHDFVYAGLNDQTNQADPVGLMCTDPFMSRPFTEKFHVYRSHKIILAPGEYHTHRVHWAPNRLVPKALVNNLGGNVDQPPPKIFERLSYFTMLRQHGAPVIATNASGDDFATYSATKLAICWWSKVQFQVGFPFADNLYYTDSLSTPAAGAETVRPDGSVVPVEVADP